MTYIIFPDFDYYDYILQPLDNKSNISLVKINLTKRRFTDKLMDYLSRFTDKIPYISKCCFLMKRKQLQKQLNKLTQKDSILLFNPLTIYSLSDIIWLKKNSCNAKISVWNWNIIKQNQIKYYLSLKANRIDVYSFDENDSKKFGLNYLPQVYRNFDRGDIVNIDSPYDYIFIGRSKGREEEILEISKLLDKAGANGEIIIIDSNNKDIANFKYLSEAISYQSIIDLESKAKILIDIVQKNQVGLTLRVMEALYLNKKVITNNHSIDKYPWYTPEQFYIIGKRNPNEISNFIITPINKIDKTLLSPHAIDNWIDRFK